MVAVVLFAIFLAILFPRFVRFLVVAALLAGLWVVNDVRQQIRDKESPTTMTRTVG